MTDHFIETKNLTLDFVDKETGRHLKVSFIEGSDKSGYLTINSSNAANPDYMKVSYHPACNELRYAFTNEYWRNQGRPNQERKKFVQKPISPNQTLVMIYLDKAALFRDDEIDPSHQTVLFPDDGAVELRLAFENSRLTLLSKKIERDQGIEEFIQRSQTKLYEAYPDARGPIKGCVQAPLTGDSLPLKIVVFGI